MREASRAGGGAFCPESCADTKTDNPAKRQSDKISIEEQRIVFLERARRRLVSEHLTLISERLTTDEKRCKLNVTFRDSLWMILLALQPAEGGEEKRSSKQS